MVGWDFSRFVMYQGEVQERVNVRSICGGSLVKESGESLVDFSN